MKKTPIIVRCVPERPRFIAYLRQRIPEAKFYFHPERDAVAAFRGACREAGAGPAVHMEDDVILTRDFRKKLEAVIAERRTMVVQFFSMRRADLEVGARKDKNFLMLQCAYLPADYSRELAEWTWPREAEEPSACDTMVGDWLKDRGEPHWIHIPNLVDHRQCVSVIDPRRSSKRQSKTFTDPWL